MSSFTNIWGLPSDIKHVLLNSTLAFPVERDIRKFLTQMNIRKYLHQNIFTKEYPSIFVYDELQDQWNGLDFFS